MTEPIEKLVVGEMDVNDAEGAEVKPSHTPIVLRDGDVQLSEMENYLYVKTGEDSLMGVLHTALSTIKDNLTQREQMDDSATEKPSRKQLKLRLSVESANDSALYSHAENQIYKRSRAVAKHLERREADTPWYSSISSWWGRQISSLGCGAIERRAKRSSTTKLQVKGDVPHPREPLVIITDNDYGVTLNASPNVVFSCTYLGDPIASSSAARSIGHTLTGLGYGDHLHENVIQMEKIMNYWDQLQIQNSPRSDTKKIIFSSGEQVGALSFGPTSTSPKIASSKYSNIGCNGHTNTPVNLTSTLTTPRGEAAATPGSHFTTQIYDTPNSGFPKTDNLPNLTQTLPGDQTPFTLKTNGEIPLYSTYPVAGC